MSAAHDIRQSTLDCAKRLFKRTDDHIKAGSNPMDLLHDWQAAWKLLTTLGDAVVLARARAALQQRSPALCAHVAGPWVVCAGEHELRAAPVTEPIADEAEARRRAEELNETFPAVFVRAVGEGR